MNKTEMKRIFPILALLMTALFAFAQPKDAWKAAAKLTAYDATGAEIYTGIAFFIDADGTLVAPYIPFTKAVRANVTDSKGKTFAVRRILGASENYGFVRLSSDARKMDYLMPISGDAEAASAGSKLYAVGYLRTKKEAPVAVIVNKAEKYDAAMFYETTLPADAKYVGCPLVDGNGRVVAVVGTHGGEALDIRFATALAITANSALDRELRALPMPKGLPTSEEEAMKYITLIDAIDPASALLAMDDFVLAYPANASGYVTRAARRATNKDYSGAESDFASALAHADRTTTSDAIHYAFSRSLYNAAINDTTAPAAGWSYERALQEAEVAFSANSLPLYQMQLGSCLFALERYAEAYDQYMAVNSSPIASDETFFTAMLALERAGGDSARVLALMDSVIARQKHPYTQRAASYFLERAQRLFAYGQYRRAVADYNEFERIIGPRNLTDTFYYLREQAEMRARMYQQALDDIQSAALSASADRKPYYQVEEALIYLTCGEYEQAKNVGNAALTCLPKHIDLLRILAVAYGETGDKTKACELLNRARELGDATVDTLLKKYQ